MNDPKFDRPAVSKVKVRVGDAIHIPEETVITMLSEESLNATNFTCYPILKFDSGYEYDTQGMSLLHTNGTAVYSAIEEDGMDDPQRDSVNLDVERDGTSYRVDFEYHRDPPNS